MDNSKVYIFLDNGHGVNTAGKHSPDFTPEMKEKYGMKRFYEYEYNRTITSLLKPELEKLGFKVFIVVPEMRDVDLKTRVTRINKKYYEVKKQGYIAFLISVHVDAAGDAKKWLTATGWSCYTTKGQNNSDKLADCLYEAAHEELDPLKKKIRTDKTDGDEDKEANFYIIKNSNLPCVLTENFFQDNKEDVEFLLSDEGKKAIVNIHVKGILKRVAKL